MKGLAKNKNFIFSLGIIVFLSVFILVKIKVIDNRNVKYLFKDEINKFCVNDFCVEKENDRWFVQEGEEKNEARERAVEVYLKKFESMDLADLVSTTGDKIEEYGFNDDKKTILTIDDKKIEIGNIGGSFDQTYIREENDNKVYTSDVSIDKSLIREKSFWQLNR